MKKFLRWVAAWCGFERVVVVRRRKALSQEQLREALGVAPDHPVFSAVMFLVDEAAAQNRNLAESPQVARDHGMLAYYSGAAAGLEQLRDVLAAYRDAGGVEGREA